MGPISARSRIRGATPLSGDAREAGGESGTACNDVSSCCAPGLCPARDLGLSALSAAANVPPRRRIKALAERAAIKPLRASCSAWTLYIIRAAFPLYCVYERDGAATSSGSAGGLRRFAPVLAASPRRRAPAINAREPDLRGSRALTPPRARRSSIIRRSKHFTGGCAPRTPFAAV